MIRVGKAVGRFAVVAGFCAATTGLAAPPPLALERTMPLAGVTGRIDHLAVDPGHGRLFVAELGFGALSCPAAALEQRPDDRPKGAS